MRRRCLYHAAALLPLLFLVMMTVVILFVVGLHAVLFVLQINIYILWRGRERDLYHQVFGLNDGHISLCHLFSFLSLSLSPQRGMDSSSFISAALLRLCYFSMFCPLTSNFPLPFFSRCGLRVCFCFFSSFVSLSLSPVQRRTDLFISIISITVIIPISRDIASFSSPFHLSEMPTRRRASFLSL
ncbi:hypothetical protein ABB37_08822 [Leptomonas pyrrhocoris]|uniref:Uncharacterized protein n=1 Tax=Leptomonas pyrrhocoris TaxID=157538 RepID=A0A0M9FSG4_LEPPY|nr:hypothetical protein ABB37_08822 [Leptomonas pyrrhocoris]KPA75160.1 hypothetical protein ABB37_08822 [Leptomonas pyrrhocoris]|eukprot:XP_015653599.1 hypothetical protein ABB37_08822 [Leptomonas pyrrhocoris]